MILDMRPMQRGETDRITALISEQTADIVLIGMPGCGKTTVGRLIARNTGRPLLDTDDMIAGRTGCSCGDYLRVNGEEAFRRLETEVLREACRRTGCVIATGGGAVTRPENLNILRQNPSESFETLAQRLDIRPAD